jgi:hypothetical protein
MKIICIGRNYAAHAKELKNEVPTAPVFFMKPDTALLKDNAPFYIPSFSNEIHYEVELVIKISKNGKTILPQFAHKYYDQITVGIDFTARDIQEHQRENERSQGSPRRGRQPIYSGARGPPLETHKTKTLKRAADKDGLKRAADKDGPEHECDAEQDGEPIVVVVDGLAGVPAQVVTKIQ